MSTMYKPGIIAAHVALLLLLCGNISAEKIWGMDDPCCSIPHDMTIACNQLPYGFDPDNIWQLAQLFGSPQSQGGCPYYYWTELPPLVNLNNCEVGTITRRFQAYGGGWNGGTYTCQQLITITEAHHYEIRFPPDASAYCQLPQAENILTNELACDLLAVSVNDLTFQVSGDACYKIMRTYRVVNWCEYDGYSGPYIVGRDEDCDNVPGDEAVWVIRKPTGQVFIDRNNNTNDANPSIGEIQTYCGHTGVPGYWRNFWQTPGSQYYANRGYWQYTQHIKVYDDVKPQISFTAPQPFCSYSSNVQAGCPGPVQIPFAINETCSDEIEIKLFLFAFNQPVPLIPANNRAADFITGVYPNYTINGSFPIGQHTFELHVKDGCGNVESVQIPFTVVDCKAPTPICIHGISTHLMPTGVAQEGMIELWAIDFISSFSSDCSPPLKYSINKAGDTPDPTHSGIQLTCADGDSVSIEIYTWDSANNPYAIQPDGSLGGPNYAHCVTYVLLKNWEEICGNAPPIVTSGIIYTPVDSAVADVEVQLSGGMLDTTWTGAAGEFDFQLLPEGQDYLVTPFKDGDDLNGISTADLIMLKKHIMGIDTIESPYALIAADLDNSGIIDETDQNLLLALVLHIDTVIAGNSSWRFVDGNYVFPDPANPWSAPFPESIVLDSLVATADSLQFIAIKIGDINCSIVPEPANLLQQDIEDRSVATTVYRLLAGDTWCTKGRPYTLVVKLPEGLEEVQGGQFALQWNSDALFLNDAPADGARELHTAQLKENKLSVSWSNTRQQTGIPGNLLELSFTAYESGYLSDWISLDESEIIAEIVTNNGQSQSLGLDFILEAARPQLFQNSPNPAQNETTISFYLPTSAKAAIIVQTPAGQVISRVEDNYEAGYHSLQLRQENLPATGVLLYTLETAGYKSTRKMVILNR